MDKQTRSLQRISHLYLSRLLAHYPAIIDTLCELGRGERLLLGLSDAQLKKPDTLLATLQASAAQPDSGRELLAANTSQFARHMGEAAPCVPALLMLSAHLALSQPMAQVLASAVSDDYLPNTLHPVAVMIGEEVEVLQALLTRDHWMMRCEYVDLQPHDDFGLSFGMNPVHARRLLQQPLTDPVALLDGCLVREPASTLGAEDFPRVPLETLLRDLQAWQQAPHDGLNIMFWGRPGTGKTESARLLAGLGGFTLYSVVTRDLRGRSRVQDVLLAMELMRHKRDALLLLDEADDLLLPFASPVHKMHRHLLLQGNPLPMLWAMNDFPLVEEATQRRFTWITHFDRPNRATRQRLFVDALRGLRLPASQIDLWCQRDWLTPGHITQVAGLCRRLGMQGKGAAGFIEQWLLEREKALLIERPPAYRMAGAYDLSLLNPRHTGLPLEQLIANLGRQQAGRILLYGAPGTGKTAFVHHLGQVLDLPVIQKRASDLLSKWVGESEQQIAGAFREASANPSILFIDEVDSLLSDRQGHQRTFETSQVNELLSWMEAYDGILLMATNLRERLDGAVGRRFDYQIELCALRPEQLAQRLAVLLGSKSGDKAAAALHGLDNLTLGDLAILERRKQLNGALAVDEVVETLRQIAQEKKGTSRPMGFLAA